MQTLEVCNFPSHGSDAKTARSTRRTRRSVTLEQPRARLLTGIASKACHAEMGLLSSQNHLKSELPHLGSDHE